MSVHYKFKSALEYDTVAFDGLHISVKDLKKAIIQQKRIGKTTDFDLQVTNAQTKEVYTDDSALIAKNTSLIIARVPLSQSQKKSWEAGNTAGTGGASGGSVLGQNRGVDGDTAADLSRMVGSEEDKIKAMMSQSTLDYDPSNYQKVRGSSQQGEVPPNYRCYKCHQAGHWIKNCPQGSGVEPIDSIKRSTGIPRSFMVSVQDGSVPGAMVTPGGFAVPSGEQHSNLTADPLKDFAHEAKIVKPDIPEDLLCKICTDLLTDAVMIPCCGNSFCDECIRMALLESPDHECPDCKDKEISPGTLIPNRFLRNSVTAFRAQTGYQKTRKYEPKTNKSSGERGFNFIMLSSQSVYFVERNNMNCIPILFL